MKQLTVFFISICILTSLSSAERLQILPTSLKITVIDYLGNVVEGASVTLYGTEEDYDNEENPLADTGYTNSKGQITFKKLETNLFYINATKDDLNNYGGGVKTDSLKAGKVNKINIVID